MKYTVEFNDKRHQFELVRWNKVTNTVSSGDRVAILAAHNYADARDEAYDLMLVDRYEHDTADIGSEFDFA